LNLGYAVRLGPGSLNFSILHGGPFPDTTVITATYGMGLGKRGYGTFSAVKGDGQSGQSFSYNQSMPSASTGLGYQLQAQTSVLGGATLSGSATEQLQDATLSEAFFHGQDSTLVSTDLAGSIDFVDHGISFARSIGGGFGVVELPGFPGVPVYANGQEVGRTDGQGRLVLPELQPYQVNEITLGDEDLPIGVDLVTSSVEIAPYGLSPAIGRFEIKSAGGVSLTIVDSQGAVLPAGTKVATADGKQHWVVAFDGVAFFDGVSAGQGHFIATPPAGACSFDLSLPKDMTKLPDLGRTICR
jgi:outer membrane usher protein